MPYKPKKTKRNERPDHKPGHRMEYERNRKKILATQSICGICGKPVDKTLKAPHPYSATIDHIVPVSLHGHPSAIENLQLAHFICNRLKSNKLPAPGTEKQAAETPVSVNDPRNLSWALDWLSFKATEDGKTNSSSLSAEADRLKQQGYVITARGVFQK